MSWRAPRNRAFLKFIRPARRPRASWGVVALIAVAVLVFSEIFTLLIIWARMGAQDGAPTDIAAIGEAFFPIFGMTTIATLALALGWAHRRRMSTLLGADPRPFRRGAALGALTALVYVAPFEIAAASLGEPSLARLFAGTGDVAIFALAGLAFVAPSALAEELMFRGYLQQQFAASSLAPLVWAVIPTAVFALLHLDPYLPIAAQWEYLLWAATLGGVACYATWRTGSLGFAIGLHVANNWFAWIVLAPETELASGVEGFGAGQGTGGGEIFLAAALLVTALLALEARPFRRWLGLAPLSSGVRD